MPLEQIANEVVFYSFYTNVGLGATGLTVTVDVYRNGTQIVTAAAATEVGGGLYKYALASSFVIAVGEYVAIFKTAGTVDVAHIPALWVIGRAGIEYLTQSLSGAGLVTYLGPVATGGDVSVKRGDDYYAVDSRSLVWTTAVEATWPDLTSATITFYCQSRAKGTVFSKAGGVTTPTGATKAVYVELTTTETETIADGVYDVQATLANGHIVTLASGLVTSIKNLVD